MVFDVLSFLVGVAAGGVTGALAMILHGLEKTADLQERLRLVTQEVGRMKDSTPTSGTTEGADDPRVRIDELRQELDEIHEEIRRMYKRSSN